MGLYLLASEQRAAKQGPLISFTAHSDWENVWCISYWFPWGTSQAWCHYPLSLAQHSLITISVLFEKQEVEDTDNQMAITKFSLQETMLSLLIYVELHPGILGFITNPVSCLHLLMKIWRFYILISKSWIFFCAFSEYSSLKMSFVSIKSEKVL